MEYNINEILKTLQIVKINNNNYKLLDKNTNKQFNINTPICYLHVGLENYKYGNKINYIIKLELNETYFENFIIDFEDTIIKILNNINKKEYIKDSQIIFSKKYNNKLKVKIKSIYNKIITKVKDTNDIEISIFDICKLSNIKVNISPNIYINNNKLITKWSANLIKFA